MKTSSGRDSWNAAQKEQAETTSRVTDAHSTEYAEGTMSLKKIIRKCSIQSTLELDISRWCLIDLPGFYSRIPWEHGLLALKGITMISGYLFLTVQVWSGHVCLWNYSITSDYNTVSSQSSTRCTMSSIWFYSMNIAFHSYKLNCQTWLSEHTCTIEGAGDMVGQQRKGSLYRRGVYIDV